MILCYFIVLYVFLMIICYMNHFELLKSTVNFFNPFSESWKDLLNFILDNFSMHTMIEKDLEICMKFLKNDVINFLSIFFHFCFSFFSQQNHGSGSRHNGRNQGN
jgi:hypothetical protein